MGRGSCKGKCKFLLENSSVDEVEVCPRMIARTDMVVLMVNFVSDLNLLGERLDFLADISNHGDIEALDIEPFFSRYYLELSRLVRHAIKDSYPRRHEPYLINDPRAI